MNSLAFAENPEQRLQLASNFQPDPDLVIAEGLAAFGVKGSGKSNLVALLIEQFARFYVPQIILDSELEYQSVLSILPHGFLATADRMPSGRDVLENGLQIVVDLKSWSSNELVSAAICQLVDELFAFAEQQCPADRVPCLVHLDEAGYWLPQKQVSYLSKEARCALIDAFTKLATRGRKYGLVPMYYTQYISQINKDVVRQSGILVLMRQMLDIDLKRYAEYISLSAERKDTIRGFARGRAIVCLPDGSRPLVQFNERATPHPSHTPRARTALRFAFTETPDQVGRIQPLRSKRPHANSFQKQVFSLLQQNPDLDEPTLASRTGCSLNSAIKYKSLFNRSK